MCKEADNGIGLMVMEDEHRSDGGGVIETQGQRGPVLNHSTVMMIDDELPGGSKLVNEVGENEMIHMGDPISSPFGSFQSLHSSQNSEEGMKGTKMVPYVPPLKETRVLQFEDTLSEMDCRSFNLIYNLLLLEGKAGNLTDLIVGMVLAEKPPAWLPVMHGRLKHLIISPEAFQKIKKAEYNAQTKARKLRTGKGKGIGRHSKRIRYFGISGKGKGRKPQKKITKPRVTHPITRMAQKNNQSLVSITGIW